MDRARTLSKSYTHKCSQVPSPEGTIILNVERSSVSPLVLNYFHDNRRFAFRRK